MRSFFLIFALLNFKIACGSEVTVGGKVIPSEIKKKLNLDEVLTRIDKISAINTKKTKTTLVDAVDQAIQYGKNTHYKITLDAGHGGHDIGTYGALGTIEKDVTLHHTLLLAKALQNKGFMIIMTRNKDEFLSLKERRVLTQESKSDLFIAIHADSNDSITARGLSIYTLSNEASDKTAEMLASKHSNDDINWDFNVKDVDVKYILINMFQEYSMEKSRTFAKILLKNAEMNRLFTIVKPIRSAGFAVLKVPNVPSVLIELGFLSNVEEEVLLTSPEYQKQMVKTIAQSVQDFFIIQEKDALRKQEGYPRWKKI